MADDNKPKIKPIGGNVNLGKLFNGKPGAKPKPNRPLNNEDPRFYPEQFENEETIIPPPKYTPTEKTGPDYPEQFQEEDLDIIPPEKITYDALVEKANKLPPSDPKEIENFGKYKIIGTEANVIDDSLVYFRKLVKDEQNEYKIVKEIQTTKGVNANGSIDWIPTSEDLQDMPNRGRAVLQMVENLESELGKKTTEVLIQDTLYERIHGTCEGVIKTFVQNADPSTFSTEATEKVARKLASHLANETAHIYAKALADNPYVADMAGRQAEEQTQAYLERFFTRGFRNRAGEDVVAKSWEDVLGDEASNPANRAYLTQVINATKSGLERAVLWEDERNIISSKQLYFQQLIAHYTTDGELTFSTRGINFWENGRGFYGGEESTSFVLVARDNQAYKESVETAKARAIEAYRKEFGQTVEANELGRILDSVASGNWENLARKLADPIIYPIANREKTQLEKDINTYLTGTGFSKEQKKAFKKAFYNHVLTATGLWVRPKKWDVEKNRFTAEKNAVFRPWAYLAEKASGGRFAFGAMRSGVYGGVIGFALGGPIGGSIGGLLGGGLGGITEYAFSKYGEQKSKGWVATANALKKGAEANVLAGTFKSSFSNQLALLKGEELSLRIKRKKSGKKKEERTDYSSTFGLVLGIGGVFVKAVVTATARNALKVPFNQSFKDYWIGKENTLKMGGAMQHLRLGGKFAGVVLEGVPRTAIAGGIGYLVSGGNPWIAGLYGVTTGVGSTLHTLIEDKYGFAMEGRNAFRAWESSKGVAFGEAGFSRLTAPAWFGNWLSKLTVGIDAKGGFTGFIYNNGGRVNWLHVPYKGLILGDALGRLTGAGPLQTLGYSLIGGAGEYGWHWFKGVWTASNGWVLTNVSGILKARFPIPYNVLIENQGSPFYWKGLKAGGVGGIVGFITSGFFGLPGWAGALIGTFGGYGLDRFIQRFLPSLYGTPLGRLFERLFGNIFNIGYSGITVAELPRSMSSTSEALRTIPIEGFSFERITQLLFGLQNTLWGWFSAQGWLVGLRQFPINLVSQLTGRFGYAVESGAFRNAGFFGRLGTNLGIYVRGGLSAIWEFIKSGPAFAKVMFSAIGSFIGTYLSGLIAYVTSSLGFAILGIGALGVFVAMVAGAAIMMVTVGVDSYYNIPNAKNIAVTKSLAVEGNTLKGTLTIRNTHASKKYIISTIKDDFTYIQNADSCNEPVEAVTKPKHGQIFYTVKNCNGDTEIILDCGAEGCDNMSKFPAGESSNALCKNDATLDPGESISWNFELRNFLGSSSNNPSKKGSYRNFATVKVNEIVGTIGGSAWEQSSGYAMLDIGGDNPCRARFEPPCGWPFEGNKSYPITQGCYTQGGTHRIEPAVDIAGMADGTKIIAPISGVLQRRLKTIEPCPGSPECAYGVFAVLKNDSYRILIAHLKPTAEDATYYNNPALCVRPAGSTVCRDLVNVGNPINVTKGDVIGLVDNSGYSIGTHLHYAIYGINSSNLGNICPNDYDRGSVLDGTSRLCQGVVSP